MARTITPKQTGRQWIDIPTSGRKAQKQPKWPNGIGIEAGGPDRPDKSTRSDSGQDREGKGRTLRKAEAKPQGKEIKMETTTKLGTKND